ncbi:hypothetical protein GCM10022261_21840 [Brevibacterium daeguense]|uniref:Uncharacterized protein n=1 Tax=Brevibacterium daeguense TaxID=909936 RepID=A0ABP8EL29_9MICO|nr:hypothetical protein [Brevibacterium daeguense]
MALPACLEDPDGDAPLLQSSGQTLKSKAATIGGTVGDYMSTSSEAMDAIDGPRAQQLYYYVGKGKSLLVNAEDSARTSGDAISRYGDELADIKRIIGTERTEWLLLESQKAAALLSNNPAEIARIEAQQAACEAEGVEQNLRLLAARSGAAEQLAAIYLELDPMAVSMEGKAYEAELFEIRDGMTLHDLGYPTPEAVAEWFIGEGIALKEHEMTYSEVAQSGFGTMSEADMVAAGIISQDALDDGYFTPGAIPGYYRKEEWQGIVEQYLGHERVGQLDAMFPGLFHSTGSPLTEPYVPSDAQAQTPTAPQSSGGPGGQQIDPNAPTSNAAHSHFVPQEVTQWAGYASAARHVWRYYLDTDGRARRLVRHFSDVAKNYQDWSPQSRAEGGRLRVPYDDLRPLDGAHRTKFYNPFDGDNGFKHVGGGRSALYHALVDGKRGVVKFDGRSGHIAHLQEGVGSTSAWKPDKWSARFEGLGINPRTAGWMADAWSSIDLNAARGLGILGVAGDAQTLFGGSQYEGARGTVDHAMAGVGLASGAAGLASTAGLVTLGTVAAPVTITAGVVAGAWGIGNMLYDNADSWSGSLDNAGAAADQWLGDNLGVVGEGLGWVTDGVLSGTGTALGGYKDAIDGIGNAWDDLWN